MQVTKGGQTAMGQGDKPGTNSVSLTYSQCYQSQCKDTPHRHPQTPMNTGVHSIHVSKDVSGLIPCNTKDKEFNHQCTCNKGRKGWNRVTSPFVGKPFLISQWDSILPTCEMFCHTHRYSMNMVRLGGTYMHVGSMFKHLQHIGVPLLTQPGSAKLLLHDVSYLNDLHVSSVRSASALFSKCMSEIKRMVCMCGMGIDSTYSETSHYEIDVSVCNHWGNSKVKYRGVLSG